MKKTCAVLAFALLALAPALKSAEMKPNERALQGRQAAQLRLEMRRLWDEHVAYTRNYIISALGNLGDKDEVAKRLMTNQDEIGEAVKPYYGGEAADKLAKLLKEHIQIAADVVAKAKAGAKEPLERAQDRWKSNAKEIAAFLSSANPHWDKDKLEDMLLKHLELTTDEVKERLGKDWSDDIAAYDKGHKHMLAFADTLASGIVEQFPEKFESKD